MQVNIVHHIHVIKIKIYLCGLEIISSFHFLKFGF